eukprot:COSAG01_NODE_9772_length_2349_cov_0.976000_2_plen_299_part_00
MALLLEALAPLSPDPRPHEGQEEEGEGEQAPHEAGHPAVDAPSPTAADILRGLRPEGPGGGGGGGGAVTPERGDPAAVASTTSDGHDAARMRPARDRGRPELRPLLSEKPVQSINVSCGYLLLCAAWSAAADEVELSRCHSLRRSASRRRRRQPGGSLRHRRRRQLRQHGHLCYCARRWAPAAWGSSTGPACRRRCAADGQSHDSVVARAAPFSVGRSCRCLLVWADPTKHLGCARRHGRRDPLTTRRRTPIAGKPRRAPPAALGLAQGQGRRPWELAAAAPRSSRRGAAAVLLRGSR